MANASTKKFQEKKLRFYKHLKEQEVVEKLYERNISFTCNSETNILQNLPDTEIHGVQELPAVFFDNAQNTLKKLVWK